MVLKRLSENISGRHRRRNRVATQIQPRLLNRIGSKNFFLSRRSVLLNNAKYADKESFPGFSPLPASTDVSIRSLSTIPPPSRGPVPFPTESSRLPHPSIRASYTRPIDENEAIDISPVNGDGVPRVHFHHMASVIEIPSHKAYTLQQKTSLWRSSQEIRFMARRNRLEYNHDGKDWRTATEEDDMIDVGDGNLVHPFTYRSNADPGLLVLLPSFKFTSKVFKSKGKVHRRKQVVKRGKRVQVSIRNVM